MCKHDIHITGPEVYVGPNVSQRHRRRTENLIKFGRITDGHTSRPYGTDSVHRRPDEHGDRQTDRQTDGRTHTRPTIYCFPPRTRTPVKLSCDVQTAVVRQSFLDSSPVRCVVAAPAGSDTRPRRRQCSRHEPVDRAACTS